MFRYLNARFLSLALGALLCLFSADSVAAEHRPVPYAEWTTASAYGPCCYAGTKGAGKISYDGDHWDYLEPWEASIASPSLPRGYGICIYVPLGEHGVLRCDRPAEQWGPQRTRLTISDHLPAYHGRGLDLSVGFLRDIDFCKIGQTDMQCARSWGVRWVKLFVFG
jgi:hypothetical protein